MSDSHGAGVLRKVGMAFIDDLKRVRNEYGCGLVEAKNLMDRFGSYEACRDHLTAGGILESDKTKIARLEAELAEARKSISDVTARSEAAVADMLETDRVLKATEDERDEAMKNAREIDAYARRCREALMDEVLVREIAMQVRHYEPISPENVRELLDDIRQGIAIYLDEHGLAEAVTPHSSCGSQGRKE